MSDHGANPIFYIKKIKIRRPEHDCTTHPLRPTTSYFCLAPTPHPPQSKRHMHITLYKSQNNHVDNCCFYKNLENAPSYFSVDRK